MDPSLASTHYAESNHVSTQTRRKALRSVTVQIIPASSSSRSRPRSKRSLQVPSPIQEEDTVPTASKEGPNRTPEETSSPSFPAAAAFKDLVFGIVRDKIPLLGAVLAGQDSQATNASAAQETPILPRQPPPDGTDGTSGAPTGTTQQDWYQRWLETMGLMADQMRERELRWTRRVIFIASLFSLLSLVMICACPPLIIYKLMRMRSELAPLVHNCIVHSVLFHHHFHHEYDDDKRTMRDTVERMISSSRSRRGTLIDVDDLISHLQSGALRGRELRLDSLQNPPEQQFTVLNQGLPYSIGVMNSGYEPDGTLAYPYPGQQSTLYQPDFGQSVYSTPQPPNPVAELCCSYTTGPPGAQGQPGQPGQPGTSYPSSGRPPTTPLFYPTQQTTVSSCPPCQVVPGPPGPPGPKGVPGFANVVTVKGPPGPPGSYGPRGPTGPPGPPGPADPGRVIEIEVTGSEGPPGQPGPPGVPGKPGRPGRRGKNGHKGPEGACGRHGTPGNPGRNGLQGAVGKPGRNGVCACKTQSIKQISTDDYGETQQYSSESEQSYGGYRSFRDHKRAAATKFPTLHDDTKPIVQFVLPDGRFDP
ncbi:hypothetical protein PRIPAC_77308 [Pristionchus pacificus]|uniref:Collagen n=1 Tax=Pristionchus pacificus TaxID=54126 RepID=A0A2A6BHG5_PRIPA|nr:hypothetical protein PRIPAC_77308 [Pristionchus pacificus]|eukprot:PDM65329.1 collagen [Pristionchus pacificus]